MPLEQSEKGMKFFMKMFCISDNIDSAVGLRLSGIEYVIVKEKDEIIKNIEKILEDKTIEIIAVTDKIYEIVEKEIKEIERTRSLPLFIRIPAKKGLDN